MSWFNHRPRVKEPSKLTPQTTSPMSDKHLTEVKEKARNKGKINKTKSPQYK